MTRTYSPLIKSQPSDSHNVIQHNALHVVAIDVGHLLVTDSCQIDPDLLAILEAWPTLPEALEAGIVAMIKGARNFRVVRGD
jgi:hypothetical protein